MAIRKRVGIVRCAAVIAAALVALAAGPGRDAQAQVAPPAVNSIAPTSGPTTGGTVVTITGARFTGATAVAFGVTPATSFTVTGANSITATSPPGTGTVDVTVTTPSGTSPTSATDQFTFVLTASGTTLSSSPNPSSLNQPVTFTARVTGAAPTGTVSFFDGATQIGTAPLTGGTATFTTSSLAAGSHSMTARYSGDANNAASVSPVLTQIVSAVTDSIRLRQMQISVTPVVAQISGQAIADAIDNAIDAGFNDNPPPLAPNGGGFTFQVPLDPPPTEIIVTRGGGGGNGGARGGGGIGSGDTGPASLANGRHGGNGAPPGTRLIDMLAIPLPPGSGMPPIGETRFSDEVVMQFGPNVTPEQVTATARRFGLTLVSQQSLTTLGRTVYTFRIPAGQTMRRVIARVEAAHVNAALQPNYTFGLTEDQTTPDGELGDPAQYVVKKFHLAEAHRISKGDNVVIAVIDLQIDFNHPNLAGSITDRYDAGCGATSPSPHGTGMAGAIASHVQLLGVAPRAQIVAICAFGGTGQAKSSSIKILKGLDYAIQHGAKIVNMSFAGPHDPALAQALQIAREKGILLIAAAGNAGPKSPPLYPGADPSVMAVTATDENDGLFAGANQGKYITVAAPGVDILVPAPDGGVQLTTGTSVATAHVSGVAALLLAHKRLLTPEQICALIVETATPLGSRGINPQFGAGLIDPLKALEDETSENASPDRTALKRFLASPGTPGKRIDDDFAALGYADDGNVLKAPPRAQFRTWMAWLDVRGSDFNRNTFGNDLKGTQINAIAGLTHRFTPDFLVGVLGGYEHFDYTSQAFSGVLKGDGWTTGAYLGWRFAPHLRFDAAVAWSDIQVNDVAGLAVGNFTGQRWLTTGGVTGTYAWQPFVLEPSARVYALWEHENSYTDSLGTFQTARNFQTGRASAGLKVSTPLAWSSSVMVAPYLGLYGDYYFSQDDALAPAPGLTTVPLLQGWSARVTGGVAATFAAGAQLAAGGEYGGIGGNTQIWTWRVRGMVPF